jgi:hypothetical protein
MGLFVIIDFFLKKKKVYKFYTMCHKQQQTQHFQITEKSS